MDGFETPYDDCAEIDFINCEICNKSIRGETLYKLHVTSPGHLKNEEALIAEGKIPQQQFLPVFEDIIQYLEYLNLDEPIIGLSYLIEVPGDIAECSGIKYNCTLCKVFAYITEAVQHVIGRKHRQKYLEKNRPDLINWDPLRPQTISGKVIRAKSEIAERQDGRGNPKPLPDKLKRRSFPRLSFQGGPKNGQGFPKSTAPSTSKWSYSSDPGRQVPEDYAPEGYQDTFPSRAPLDGREMFTEPYKQDRDHLVYPEVRDYQHESSGDYAKVLGIQDQDRRQYGQREEPFTDAFRKPSVQKDVLKEFYTEELRREQLAKAQKWPNDNDSYQHEHTRRPRGTGPTATQSSYDGENSHEMFKLIKDYRHDALAERSHEPLPHHGPSRVSPSRSGDFSRKMSNIPDPFMRFLKGKSSLEEPKLKKRKSRFSDATAEELQTAHEMFSDEYGPPHPKYPPMRPENREFNAQLTDPPMGFKRTETYQKEPLPESTGDVFEMLKNIEIENEDDASFLKEQLCSVLREFKIRKAMQAKTGPTRTEFDNMRPVTRPHEQDRYGRAHRENIDMRRLEDPYDDRRQESYDRPMLDDFKEHERPEPRYSDRKPYKEVKRWSDNNQPQHTPGYDMPAPFPEMVQEPLLPRDYQSADDFSDYQSSTSHLPIERGPRMNRPPQYSRNLDKITSTLLELVKRK